MGILLAIAILAFMILVMPMFDRMWTEAVLPMIYDSFTLTAFEELVWTYFPYILMVFFFVAAFVAIKRRVSL